MNEAMKSFLLELRDELVNLNSDLIDVKINNTKNSIKDLKPEKINNVHLINPKNINPLLIFKFNESITEDERELFFNTLCMSKITFLKHKNIDLYVIPLSLAGFKNATDEEIASLCRFLSTEKEAYTFQYLMNILSSLNLSDEDYHIMKNIILNKTTPYRSLSISIRNSQIYISPEYAGTETPFIDQSVPSSINDILEEEYKTTNEDSERYLVVVDEKTGENLKFDLGDIVFKRRVIGFDKSFLLVEAKGKEAAIPLEYCTSKQKFITSLLVQVGDPCLEHIPQKYWVHLLRKIVDETPEDNNNIEVLYKAFKMYIVMQFQVYNNIEGAEDISVVSKRRKTFYKDEEQYIYVPFEHIYDLLKKESGDSRIVFMTRLNSVGIEVDPKKSLIKIPITLPEFKDLYKDCIETFEQLKYYGQEVASHATGNFSTSELMKDSEVGREMLEDKKSKSNSGKNQEDDELSELDSLEYETFDV